MTDQTDPAPEYNLSTAEQDVFQKALRKSVTVLDTAPKCNICGEPMPIGEEMFNYHGYSGPCPKPPSHRAEIVPAAPDASEALDWERDLDILDVILRQYKSTDDTAFQRIERLKVFIRTALSKRTEADGVEGLAQQFESGYWMQRTDTRDPRTHYVCKLTPQEHDTIYRAITRQQDKGGDKGEISDGYHTFNELYEHRHILFLHALMANRNKAWRSKYHSDGKMMAGWFIAGLETELGQATYHLPERMWALFGGIKEVPTAPEWDGHTSDDVLVRIREDAIHGQDKDAEIERLRAALRLYAVVNIGAWDYGKRAREALREGEK